MGRKEQKEVELEKEKALDQDKPSESDLRLAREIKQKQIEEERQKIEEEAKRLEELLKQLDEKEAAEREIIANVKPRRRACRLAEKEAKKKKTERSLKRNRGDGKTPEKS